MRNSMLARLIVLGVSGLIAVACGSSSSDTSSNPADAGADAIAMDGGGEGSPDAEPGALSIAASTSEVPVVAGASATFDVQAVRGSVTGDIAIAISGLPSGVTALPATIAAGATKATVTLNAAMNAALGGPMAFTVTATAGSRNASAMTSVFVRGQPGTLDVSYGTGGVVFAPITAIVAAATVQPDGKVVVAGSFQSGMNRAWVARFDAQGAADATFAGGGSGIVDFGTGNRDFFDGLTVQNDGKLVLVGHSLDTSSNGVALVARMDASGMLDTTFNASGKYTAMFGATPMFNELRTSIVQTDGKILAVGWNGPSPFNWGMMRMTAQGGTDGTFGSGGQIASIPHRGFASCAAQQADGKLIVGGTQSDMMGSSQVWSWTIARLDPATGAADPSFGTGGYVNTTFFGSSALQGCVMDANGRLVVAGYVPSNGSQTLSYLVGRYADGALDPSFGSGGVASAPLGTGQGQQTTVLLQPDGKILSLGNSPIGGITVLRYKTDGTLDATFGSGGELGTNAGLTFQYAFYVTYGAIDTHGRLVIAGNADQGSAQGIYLARVWL